TKTFRAQVGLEQNDEFLSFAQTLSSPQIAASPLYVQQEISSLTDGQIGLNENLIYKIKYRNTTDSIIEPVVITIKIDSRAVDWGSMIVVNGFFNSADNTITWNASSLPALASLAPRAEGEIELSFRTKNQLPITGFSDKNFTIVTTAKIDSPNTPLSLIGTSLTGQNQLTVKISSYLTLLSKGFYQDKLIANSGPLPPRVGQKTTYTLYFQLLNTGNDLSETKIEAYLPSYLSWENKTFPPEENIIYDPSSGKITWRPDRLTASVGVLSPVKQVAFQVGFTPSLGQVGKTAVFIKDAKVRAQDSFTQTEISATALELNSSLPDDPTIGIENSRVSN
ncbi:MAG: hypothetical protein AAB724_02820, partial [Patescibacteria group bacterium]